MSFSNSSASSLDGSREEEERWTYSSKAISPQSLRQYTRTGRFIFGLATDLLVPDFMEMSEGDEKGGE
jgi:hypothetical protein